ncbi:segregation and condensation protein B [Streptococcus moroccensis]|uniref:Segregation and condensation protein B n=1 Tax=Streptococcus moroccensis TaxID=1451356 RepID=A0ABT9YQH6_9STRE|nr:segregation and condensation protein B [Streptococcus moroccensis]
MSRLAEIEALLFIAGEEGLSLRQMAEVLEIPPTGLSQSLEKLSQKYQDDEESCLALIQSSGKYRLVTKEEHADLLRRFSRTPINQSMSRALLETLSIVAYKQPITRVEIDDIRGVNSSAALSKLVTFELIASIGTKDVIGRPRLYATTEHFLDFLGINSLEELPEVSELDLEAEESQLFEERADLPDEDLDELEDSPELSESTLSEKDLPEAEGLRETESADFIAEQE